MCLISTVHNPLLLVNVEEERLEGEGEEIDLYCYCQLQHSQGQKRLLNSIQIC